MLLADDVGLGKTEVAIRAAFKAACDSKQTAVLVPTTILAFQHYKTFSDRMKGLPVQVDYINRFKTPAQQKETLQKLAEGKIEIIIGTSAIIAKRVKFKNLGLLIVDEEQKFGVKVKDRLKELKVNVDVLTLTATPIPRTLAMTLYGDLDVSVIDALGHVVWSNTAQLAPYIETSNLSVGAYMIRAVQNGGSFSGMVVVQK